jgi:hypothetical protein
MAREMSQEECGINFEKHLLTMLSEDIPCSPLTSSRQSNLKWIENEKYPGTEIQLLPAPKLYIQNKSDCCGERTFNLPEEERNNHSVYRALYNKAVGPETYL